jgi:hypothetical protein
MALDRPEGSAAVRPRVYCTYFDANYLSRGLALWRSLRRVSPDAVLWICCLDDATFKVLERLTLSGVHLFSLGELERRFPDLAAVKPTRSRVEYYFTSTPSVLRFVFDTAPDVDQVTYLDSDLYFFADPEPLFHELDAGNGAIGIIAHRFPARLKEREQYGIYNVGWLTFSRDERGLACLDDWRRRCIEWCYNRVEGDRFADQKYLDSWPQRFDGVVVLQHKGANVALWNLEQAQLEERLGKVVIDGEPLLFYHFHALSALNSGVFHTSAAAYGIRLARETERLIYRPYLRALQASRRLAATAFREPRQRRNPMYYIAASARGVARSIKMLPSLWRAGANRGEYLMIWPWS